MQDEGEASAKPARIDPSPQLLSEWRRGPTITSLPASPHKRAAPFAVLLSVGLAVAACREAAFAPAEATEPHLFAGMEEWRLQQVRKAVLPDEVGARLRALLAEGHTVQDAEDALWIARESIPDEAWQRRGYLGRDREDVEFWAYRPRAPLALPTVELHHADAGVQPFAGELPAAPVHGYAELEGTVVVALPAAQESPGDGFSLSYPTPAGVHLADLRDLVRPADATPLPRETTLAYDTRPGLLVGPGLILRRTLRVPEGARLHFGVGSRAIGLTLEGGRLVCGASQSDGIGFRWSLSVSGGQPQTLWESFVGVERAGRFEDASLSLAEWSGQEVELEFECFASEGEDEPRASLHDFGFLSEPFLGRAGHSWRDGPNVLVVLLDTLRADALGCYGGTEAETPVLDGLAQVGVRFAHARSSSSWTLPSHASLFSSLLPSQHLVLERSDRLPGDAVTLAEVLRDAGWRTLALADQGVVSPSFGFARGFDRFLTKGEGIFLSSGKLLRWIDACDARFFAFLQTYQVHTPYAPADELRAHYVPEYDGGLPAEVGFADLEDRWVELSGEPLPDDDRAYLRGLYHGEVAYTDKVLGWFFDELNARGLWENTLVIVTSDHGEEFWEHGDHTHGKTLYEEQLRVPLLVYHPELFRGGDVVDNPVRLEDIAPTVVEALGVEAPSGWVGVPLTDREAQRDLLAVLKLRHRPDAEDPMAYAVVRDGQKWIEAVPGFYRGEPELGGQLFDIDGDPAESRGLADPQRAAALRATLEELRAKYPVVGGARGAVQLSGEEIEQLRGLGYIR